MYNNFITMGGTNSIIQQMRTHIHKVYCKNIIHTTSYDDTFEIFRPLISDYYYLINEKYYDTNNNLKRDKLYYHLYTFIINKGYKQCYYSYEKILFNKKFKESLYGNEIIKGYERHKERNIKKKIKNNSITPYPLISNETTNNPIEFKNTFCF